MRAPAIRLTVITPGLVLAGPAWAEVPLGAELFRDLAQQGNAEAQFALGQAYDYSEGVDRELVTAYMGFGLGGWMAGRGTLPSGPGPFRQPGPSGQIPDRP